LSFLGEVFGVLSIEYLNPRGIFLFIKPLSPPFYCLSRTGVRFENIMTAEFHISYKTQA
jgi:hypothetical protein